MKKTILAAILLAAAFSFPAYAEGMVYDEEGIWYDNGDGTWPVGWFQDGNGNWFYFGQDGYAVEGWHRENGKAYYLRHGSGIMIADRIITLEGTVYRFDENGEAFAQPRGYTGWMLDDAGWYYRLSDGSFAADTWKKINGTWYYFDRDEYMVTGMINDGGVIYYLDENGAMVKDESRTIDGVTYSFDSTGAGSVVWPYKQPLNIPPEEEKTEFHRQVDAAADQVLSGIINDSMSQWQKAVAIYQWVKGHVRYNGYSPVGDWVSGAWDGLKKRHGDCYTYYSLSAELLNRAGMRTIEVIRSTDNNHYWNLVNVDGNWYHFDPCPRRTGGDFCLLTNGQIAWSKSHIFDHSLYPPTP